MSQPAAAATGAAASKKRKAEDADSSTAAAASSKHEDNRSSDGDDSGADEAEAEDRAKKSRKDGVATTAPAAAASSDSDEDEDEDAEMARPSFGSGGRGGLGAASSSSSAAAASSSSSAAAAPSVLSFTDGSSALGARLLALAGYKGSGGLGKHGTGRIEPVKSSTQVSKEGIGFDAPVQRREHNFEAFEVEVELKPIWITQHDPASASSPPLPSLEIMRSSWATLGPRDPTVLSDARYCALDVQEALLAAKSAFDGIPSLQFRQARERSNPFERIRGEFFQNRAALKMAEMDAMCGRIFTQPPSTRNILGQPPRKREIIQIGDVCAGPGGFSEFMLTVLKWRCAVHGFTLRGNNDFNTGKFNRNAPTHSFHAWYGVDNSGDITRNENMRDYTIQVDAATKGKGLHVMMADGGFSVVGRENMQEYLSRQLVLCQCLMALANLREGGVFVCKLFDSFLPFTVELLWIVRKCFSHFALIKPNQSRPANSERYVVAHGFLQRRPAVVEYLFEINQRINDLRRGYKLDALTAVDFNANRDRANRERDRVIREAAASASAAAAAAALKFQPSSDGPLNADSATAAEAGVKMEDEPAAIDGEAAAAVKTEPAAASSASSEPAVKSEAPDAASDAAADAAATAAPSEPQELDILHLVPASVLASDPAFVSYVCARNESYAARQIFTLRRLKQYVEDANLKPDDQEQVRRDCLAFWSLSQQPPPPLPPIEDLRPLAERVQRRVIQQTLQAQREAANAARSSATNGMDSPRSNHKGKSKKKKKIRAHSDSDSGSSDGSASGSDSDGSKSHSSGRSRSSSRSSDRTPPPPRSPRSPSRTPSPPKKAAAAAASSSSSSAVVAARASSRSPSPPPIVSSFKKLYVHYDPQWGARHIDAAYPLNAGSSFFWTNAHSRRMVERHIPDDIAASLQLLSLPNEQERARLRAQAEMDPSAPADPRMTQLELLARFAPQWYLYPIPIGGIRHTVYFSLQGMGHIDAQGAPTAWAMQPPLRVPADTILDVVWSHGKMYVLDAWSLPSPADLFVYRSRPRLLDRFELAELLVESCGDERLRIVHPVPLLEWRSNPTIQDAVRRITTHDPVFDLYFLRDGPRVPAQTSFHWSPSDEVTFKQVDQLINYVISKQMPQPPPAPSAGAARAAPVAAMSAAAAAAAAARPR